MKKIIWFVLLQLLSVSILFAQGKPYEGPDDPAGDVEIEREGYMIGNRIRLYFQNNTELAKWTETYRGSQWSRWPDTDNGVRMLDGIALLIGAKVYINGDSIPVTNPIDIEAEDLTAICIQHEIDHLNGVLILDHVSNLKRNIYRKKIEKLMKKNQNG
jgi:hypothetical protein